LRKATAIIGTAVLSLGFALVAPVAANAATTTYALDCFSVPYNNQSFYVLPGDTVTLEVTGFTELYDNNLGSTIRALDPTGDTVELSAGDYFDFWDPTNACTDYFDASVDDAVAETAPSGSRLFTQDITIPADTTNEIVVTDNDPDPTNSEHLLNGIDTCRLATQFDGRHVYGTLDVTILTAGTYTFRSLSTNPAGYYVGLNPFDPIGDPFLAVYSSFDPANPDSNVVGCNDDLNDVGGQNDAEYTSEGTIIEGHVPRFEAALTPGHYTLVLFTWEDMGVVDFAAGNSQWAGDSFTPGAKSSTFELWGPVGGLALGNVALAATGVETTYGLVGVGAGVLGFVLLVVSRRRRTARA
jgi:LPXTG-motif cell wall-anchored protein